MEQKQILEVKNLSVALEGEQILRDVSFKVDSGQAVAVIGPNGAGKTMLFRALLGLVPFSGEIKWRDDIRIGYAPQKFSVDKSTPITVKEFFLLQSKSFWNPTKKFVEHLSHELELVGLNVAILSKPLSELSGGEMQRLLVAWAMLQHPDVLLFDEPTAGVDMGFENNIYNVIYRVQKERGTTILLISHDLSVIYRHAQTVLCLNKTIICQGAPQDVLNQIELQKIFGDTGYYSHKSH